MEHSTALAVAKGACIGVLFAATAGLAQESADEDVSPNISVSDRFARNFGADGVAAGGFTLLPSVTLAAIYDDNIFTENLNPTDDYIGDFGAALRIRSNWSTHGMELFGRARRLQFADNDDQSSTDYSAGGSFTFDFTGRSDVTFSAVHREAVEPRRTPQTAVGAVEPVKFSTSAFAIDFDLRQNKFAEKFGVSYQIDDFDDAALLAGGIADQDFRDRKNFTVYGRQYYRFRPAIALFVGANAEWNDYDSPQLALGADQDSRGYGVNGGIAVDINKVARGEVSVGYQKRNYDDPVFSDVEGLNVDGSLEYFLSDLTTVTLDADRSIRDTAVPGVAGSLSNGIGLSIEHELIRPIMLVGEVEYRKDDFRGIDREDTLLTAGGGIDYAFRREVIVSVRYTYFNFDSSGIAARDPFNENVVRIGLELRM